MKIDKMQEVPFNLLVFMCLAECVSGNAHAVDLYSGLKLSYEGAYNIEEDNLSKSIVSVEPEFEWTFDSGNKLVMISKLSQDLGGTITVGDRYEDEPFSPGDKVSLDSDDDLLFELREFYYQMSVFGNQLTIGKQQIAWGQADGVTVLDIVNPLDYTELTLDDLETARIPLWSFNYQLQFDDSSLQLIWIVDQTYSDFPSEESEFFVVSPRYRPRYDEFPDTTEFTVLPLDKPSNIVSESDAGFEFSKYLWGWDMSLNYLYHFSDNPVFYRYVDNSGTNPAVTVEGTYRRTHTIGSNLSKSFGDYVLRTEWAYSTDRYVTDYNPEDDNGLLHTDELNYVIGLDYYGLDASLISFQFYQSRFGDHTSTLSREKIDTTFTLLYNKDLLNETLSMEAQFLYGSTVHDSLVRLSTQYKIDDVYTVIAGVDVFGGNEGGFFGQVKRSDRFYFEMIAQF